MQDAIGIFDFLVAGQLMFIEPHPMFPDPSNAVVILSVGISVQLLCIALLIRHRGYYLKPEGLALLQTRPGGVTDAVVA